NLEEVRVLSHDILPLDLEEDGIHHAFNTLAKNTRKIYKLNCIVKVDSSVTDKVDIETASNLYHIAQEATRNAAIHGNPENIRITLNSDEKDLYLNIDDDGSGFPAAKNENDGMGIHIMRHRM